MRQQREYGRGLSLLELAEMYGALSCYAPCASETVRRLSKVGANVTFPEVSKVEVSMAKCFLRPSFLRFAETAPSSTQYFLRPFLLRIHVQSAMLVLFGRFIAVSVFQSAKVTVMRL